MSKSSNKATDKREADKATDNKSLAELRLFAVQTTEAAKKASAASVHLIRAAILGQATFSTTVDTFYGEIRADVGGLAKKVGAERNKDGDAFVVPGNIRAQVSQVLRAIKFGVDLGTIESPRGAGEIRKDTSKAAEAAEAAQQSKAEAALTGDDAVRMTVIKALAEAATIVKAAEGEVLSQMQAATAAYCENILAIRDKASKDASKDAAALAKAA